MSGRRGRGRRVAVVVVRGLVAAAVVAGAAVTVVAVQDRDEVGVEAHRAAHEAVTDLEAMRDARAEIVVLDAEAGASAEAERVDEVATVEIIIALDQLQTLRDRIALAEGELARAREVSAEQVARLDVLKGCVRRLEQARSSYIAGDQSGATAALADGAAVCDEAEALTGGSGAAHPFDFPDPFVLRDGNDYYAFGTNGPAGTVQVVSSRDLSGWEVRGAALNTLPEWASSGFTWAPSAIRSAAGSYLLFYTVRHRFSGKQCISRAVSDGPAGPYVDTSAGPLMCQVDQGGSIDPSPYMDETGGLHLVWKAEGETVGLGASLWTVPLQPDGSGVAWFPTKLIAVDRGWEGRTIEGPSMAKVGDQWILLYSANRWDSADYSTGYAVCDGPSGPCVKPADNRVLRTDDVRAGPGGAEFFRTADGQLKVAYAAWDAGEVGIPNPRRLHLGTVSMTPLGLRIS